MTDEDSTYQAALDREAEQRQIRVGGATNVQPLRMPGAIPPEAHAAALERLLEAMCVGGTISRDAAAAYGMIFKLAAVTAPYGEHGPAVTKILANLHKRLDAHLATVPDNRPSGAA
jgi:hypothetical protein